MKRTRFSLINKRRDAGITQEELATIVGISRAYLSNIESGKHTPSLDVAYKIAKALKSTVDDIFFIVNVRKTNNEMHSA